MMRTRTLRALVAAAAILAIPAVVAAQQTTGGNAVPQTHTVVLGETLWGLSQRYLGDPYRWRDIYELNAGEIKDPHWIYPGQVLKLPGSVTSVAVTVAPVVPVAAPADTTRPTPAPVSTRAPVANSMTAPTVFRRRTAAVRSGESADNETPPMPTVRQGEYVRAPYVTKPGAITGEGRVIGSAALGTSGQPDTRDIFQAYDGVIIETPAGAQAKKGDRFVALRVDADLPGQGRVVVPTGVVEVTRPQAPGVAGLGQVVQLFGEMKPGQILVPLDTDGVSSTARPSAVADGRWASIKWLLAAPVLPTMQSYAVLDLTLGDGVKPGDEFLVFRPQQPATPSGPGAPEIAIGRAQAIRVTPFGTTAIVISQVQAAIDVGAMVRMSAKMP